MVYSYEHIVIKILNTIINKYNSVKIFFFTFILQFI